MGIFFSRGQITNFSCPTRLTTKVLGLTSIFLFILIEIVIFCQKNTKVSVSFIVFCENDVHSYLIFREKRLSHFKGNIFASAIIHRGSFLLMIK